MLNINIFSQFIYLNYGEYINFSVLYLNVFL